MVVHLLEWPMFLRLALAFLLCAPAAQAATIVALYGDDDGFGSA
jgi:hypothetical protein